MNKSIATHLPKNILVERFESDLNRIGTTLTGLELPGTWLSLTSELMSANNLFADKILSSTKALDDVDTFTVRLLERLKLVGGKRALSGNEVLTTLSIDEVGANTSSLVQIDEKSTIGKTNNWATLELAVAQAAEFAHIKRMLMHDLVDDDIRDEVVQKLINSIEETPRNGIARLFEIIESADNRQVYWDVLQRGSRQLSTAGIEKLLLHTEYSSKSTNAGDRLATAVALGTINNDQAALQLAGMASTETNPIVLSVIGAHTRRGGPHVSVLSKAA